MPRHAPELECSIEDKASLVAITKSRTAEARVVERNVRHSAEEASRPKISYARQLKLSSEGTMSAPNPSAGGSARSRTASFKIQWLIYAI